MSKLNSQIWRDTLTYLPVKFLPAISGLLTIYFLTKTLSTTFYGAYSFILAAIVLCGQFVNNWINSAVVYLFPDYHETDEIIVLHINVVAIQLILFVFGALCFTLISYFAAIDFITIVLGLLLLIAQSFLSLSYSFLQVERKILIQAKSASLQSIIQVLGIMACYFFFRQNLKMVFLALFFSYFVANIYVIVAEGILNKIGKLSIFKLITSTHIQRILRYGLPVCIWLFATQFYTLGDRILFKYLNFNDLVGNYIAFKDLAIGLSSLLTMPLLLASHPIIMETWKKEKNTMAIEKVLIGNIELLITLFTICACALLLIGEWLLVKIVGVDFLLSNTLMFLVLIAVFLASVSLYLHKGLEVMGQTLIMLKIALILAVLSLVLNIFVIPAYGVLGACITAIVIQFLYCLIVYNFSRRIFRVNFSIIFILRHLLLVSIAYFLLHYLLPVPNSLLWRFVSFSIISIYLILSSKKIRSLILGLKQGVKN